jgi:NAD(P)-dependent dehydrogenase (short-subunit alcohol dehydrogenase family)
MGNNRENILAGKKVVLLGGTSGIGLATAEAAAKAGALVTVVSSNQHKVDEALTILPEGSEGFATDLGNEKQIAQLFKEIGELDHLVFTAGESLKFSDLHGLTSKRQNFLLICVFGEQLWRQSMLHRLLGRVVQLH